MDFNTDLIIVGAGAAGLMAAVTAGESALRCVVVERRHRPGLKLLMCGNNRCNISHAGTPEELKEAYGEPTASFLSTALQRLSPGALRTLFARWELPTIVNRDRIYPATEKADDVLHCFTDKIRDYEIPFMTNCPVDSIEALPEGGFLLKSHKITMTAKYVLLCTGGFSYPKTGSVGDGQRFAKELGLDVTDPRPGLAGVTISTPWLRAGDKADIQQAEVTIFDGERRHVAVTRGNLLVEGDCLRGTAIFDAVRQISRNNLQDFSLVLDLFPGMSVQNLQTKLGRGSLANALDKLDIPPALSDVFAQAAPHDDPAQFLKRMPLDVTEIRPLKEAIVTVGGVALHEIDPQTMECKRIPGLFFAGELMDVDGPTGGFNLHAAFATARLAVTSIAAKCGKGPRQPSAPYDRQPPYPKKDAPRRYDDARPSRQQNYTPRKRSDRGDRWDKPEPSSWNRRPNR